MTKDSRKSLYGLSLFSGAGIGDLGFRAGGVHFLAACEVEHERAVLDALNFPEARHFTSDIWHIGDELSSYVASEIKRRKSPLFLVACTAPCQGMSKNGQGTLLNLIRKGERPKLDPRNRLVLPALDVIKRLLPEWIVFENVIEMRNTMILDHDARLRPILEIITEALSPDYVGSAYNVEFADYGIPQRRQRLITVYTRSQLAKRHFLEGIDLIPPATHARNPTGRLKPWVSVSEAIAFFPELDSSTEKRATSDIPFHRVPVLDPKKYEWIRHTPPSASAFDNQCINAKCRFQENVRHGASHGTDGINRANGTTPLYCERCGKLLPRPYTVDRDGLLRIMSGYTSAYKRMAPELPAPALTRNLSFPCSDQKIHPFQNRVLSLAEAMTIQTMSDYEYKWGPIEVRRGRTLEKRTAPDSLIRLVIGESVPPRFFQALCEHIRLLSTEKSLPRALEQARAAVQYQLQL